MFSKWPLLVSTDSALNIAHVLCTQALTFTFPFACLVRTTGFGSNGPASLPPLPFWFP
jgi:hypothetical protein